MDEHNNMRKITTIRMRHEMENNAYQIVIQLSGCSTMLEELFTSLIAK